MAGDAQALHAAASRLITRDVEVAVDCLLRGGLVGLPTETVYGLAADADSPAAVARVYATKGRPADHPLIVHVGGLDALDPGPGAWAAHVPDYARRLADAMWPGPLTLVLPRAPRAGDHVTGGQPTVALRVPRHPLARKVIQDFSASAGYERGGVAAPSANRFGRVSPTTAAHVAQELGPALRPGIDCILDGGASAVGIESAIVDCSGPAPVVLRPGAIGVEQIARIAGVEVVARQPTSTVRAPGMLDAHYAPRAHVIIAADGGEAGDLARGAVSAAPGDLALGQGPAAPAIGLLAAAGVPTPAGVVRLSAPSSCADFARVLYAALREADALALRRVIVVPPPFEPGETAASLAAAIRDRLRRAAARPDDSA